MESQPGVALGTSYYQHQFFPGVDLSLSPDPAEAKWDKCGRYVERERNDWDVKSWNWDSLLFSAQPAAAVSSTQLEAEVGFRADPKVDSRSPPLDSSPSKPIVVDASSPEDEDAECLTLKLGARTYSSTDDSNRNGKRQRASSPGCQQQQQQQQQYPMCQVDDCKADLSNAKDYHRRHKVCEMHSKAAKAPVSGYMQRFCQQCSRFHTLPEFDEGKRSCRRRLAGHNRRRRKTQPEAAAAQAYLLADEDVAAKSAGLLRLLQLLSQLQAASTLEKVTAVQERDLALEYLRRAVSVSSAMGDFTNAKVEGTGYSSTQTGNMQNPEMKFNSLPATLSPDAQLLSALSGMPLMEAFSVLLQNNMKGQAKDIPAPLVPQQMQSGRPTADFMHREQHFSNHTPAVARPAHSVVEVDGPGPAVHKLFPLQSTSTVDKHAASESRPPLLGLLGGRDRPSSPVPVPTANVQAGHSQQSSESQSGSDQSPESSYADWQDRTGRISFKLFDKNPGDFPQLLRSQILEWLSHVPSDMESYIRPGCVVLAIFVSMPAAAWKRLCNDLLGNLKRLIGASSTSFWSQGRILVQVCDQSAYIVDGRVQGVAFRPKNLPQILSIRPLAAVRGEETEFVVQGFDLTGPDTRVYCACEGKYNHQSWKEGSLCTSTGTPQHQPAEKRTALEETVTTLSFMHGACHSVGRCFIEVERSGGSSFAPVLVTDKAVCEEVRCLEDEFMTATLSAELTAQKYAFPDKYAEEFIDLVQLAVEYETARVLQDLGWMLQKRYWKSVQKRADCGFNGTTMKRLLVFAIEREWRAVVKTLLDILLSFEDEATTVEVLQSVNLLHRASRRNSLAMVEMLSSYKQRSSCFSPDAPGPAGLTPLHVAACIKDAERVIAALASDEAGLQAWNAARDFHGQTPFDCALSHGNFTYIQLVWSRIASSKTKAPQVIVDIPSKAAINNWTPDKTAAAAAAAAGIELPSWTGSSTQQQQQHQHQISTCAQVHHRRSVRQMAGLKGPMYRPFMLSMVAIAAVCVCVCLLLKGPPEVRFVLSPFTWESVQFGPK